MQQKLQFIITVLHEPKLLIFDEPFTGFDPINTNLIKNEILNLRDQGATILFSTHNMESVEELCDHIALINNSKKILDGPVREIRNSHKTNTYEIGFKGDMDLFKKSLNGHELLEENSLEGITKAKVKLAGGAKLNDLLRQVIAAVEVHHCTEIIPGIRDIFIYEVKKAGNNI